MFRNQSLTAFIWQHQSRTKVFAARPRTAATKQQRTRRSGSSFRKKGLSNRQSPSPPPVGGVWSEAGAGSSSA